MSSFSDTTPDKTSAPPTQGGSSSTPSSAAVTSYTDNTGTEPHHSGSANTTNYMGRNLAYHPQTGEWLKNPPLTTNEINQSARLPLIQASSMAWVDACAKGLIPAHQASDNQLVHDPQTSERSDFPQTDGEHNKTASPTHIHPNNTIGMESGRNFHNQASNNQSVSESPYQNNAVLVNRLAAEDFASQGHEVVTVEEFFRLAHEQDSNIPPAPNGGQHVGNTQPQQFEVLSAEDFIRFCEERDKIQHARPVFIQPGNRGKRAIEELYEENNGTFYTPEAEMAHSSKKRKMSLNWHANNIPQPAIPPSLSFATSNGGPNNTTSSVPAVVQPSRPVPKPKTTAKQYVPKPQDSFDDNSLVQKDGWPVPSYKLRPNAKITPYIAVPEVPYKALHAAPPNGLREDLPPLDHPTWGLMSFSKLTNILSLSGVPITQANCEHYLAIMGNDLQWEFKIVAEGHWDMQYKLDECNCKNAWRTEKKRREKVTMERFMETLEEIYGPCAPIYFEAAKEAARVARAQR